MLAYLDVRMCLDEHGAYMAVEHDKLLRNYALPA
jgi:hypothetical protein